MNTIAIIGIIFIVLNYLMANHLFNWLIRKFWKEEENAHIYCSFLILFFILITIFFGIFLKYVIITF